MPQTISHALRHGRPMDDRDFDRVYPMEQRFRSWLHWTPIEVAQRACAMLAPRSGSKVLDVGSGVGKVCLVGALTTDSQWFGIERDSEMVQAAIAAARTLHVETRAHFLLGDMTSVTWSDFDAFYLFNPFAETLFTADTDLDALARREAYVANIEFVQHQLSSVGPGTRIVTYHGFGGDMPPGFDLVRREPALEDELCLWIRRGTRRRG
jgi:SAM-dependent methyltransferase